MKRTFTRDFMQDVIDDYDRPDDVTLIYDKITGNGRWTIYHEVVFEYGGTFYRSTYGEAATECQDERPYEYEKEFECIEVRPVEVVETRYEEVP